MNVKLTPRRSSDGKRVYYTYEWGKRQGERRASGIWTYSEPKDLKQKNHNKKILNILEEKRSQLFLNLLFSDTSDISLP
jgi:hypothetical protein